MTNTAYSVLYGAVTTKLGLSDSASTAQAKICVNDAIREIRNEENWPFINGLNSFIIGTGAKTYTPADTYYEQPERVRVTTQKTVGDTSTSITTSNPSGTTWRFTYNGTGTDPQIGIGYQEVGDKVTMTGFTNTGFNVTNGTLTGVGTNYFDLTIAASTGVETKVGPVIKFFCACDGIVARRSDRDETVKTLTYSTEYIYSVPTLGSLEFNIPITTTVGIFYDYKKSYVALSGDSDASEIPPSYDHVVTYLALALMLELKDDSRADKMYAKYKVELEKMRRRYVYNDDIEMTIMPGVSKGQ